MAGPRRSFVALVLSACAAGAVYGLLQPAPRQRAVQLRLREIVRLRGGPPILVLQEKSGERRLPIPVSRAQAELIERSLHGHRGLAPSSLEALGGRVLRASIDGVSRDRGFRGHLAVGSGSRELEIEGAAGEALALALEAGAPIFADPAVLDEAAVSPADLHGRSARSLRSDPTPAPVLHI